MSGKKSNGRITVTLSGSGVFTTSPLAMLGETSNGGSHPIILDLARLLARQAATSMAMPAASNDGLHATEAPSLTGQNNDPQTNTTQSAPKPTQRKAG